MRTARYPSGLKRAGNTRAILLLIAVAAVLGSLLAVAITSGGGAPNPGLCDADRPPAVHDVWFVDATDALTAQESAMLRQVAARRLAALPVGGKLTITALSPGSKGLAARPLLSQCKPRDGSQASALTENPTLIRKRYEEEFLKPVHEALGQLERLGDAERSPILAALYELAAQMEGERAAVLRLLIVSDLLEYSPLVSHYARDYQWETVRSAPRVAAMQGRLSGADVTVRLRSNVRTRPLQHERHTAFWESYFRHAGVRDYRQEPL